MKLFLCVSANVYCVNVSMYNVCNDVCVMYSKLFYSANDSDSIIILLNYYSASVCG